VISPGLCQVTFYYEISVALLVGFEGSFSFLVVFVVAFLIEGAG